MPSAYRTWREGLEREAALPAQAGLVFDTLYLGGGTPSLLDAGDVAWLLDLVRSNFRQEIGEFTLEANPGGGADRLSGWRKTGVSRLSVGVQSFDGALLETLGRPYSVEEARAFCRAGRETGFDTFAIDLMTGVPGESPGSIERTLEETLRLEPDHVSLYLLENVGGLPFEEVLGRHPVDEDAAAESFRQIRDALETAGLRQYEISNFARLGKECRHNLKYWRYQPFLGLGPSAGSHVDGRRWSNSASLEVWASSLRRGEQAREDVVELAAAASAREALIFGLRLVEGVDLDDLSERFRVDTRSLFGREIGELVDEGLLVREAARIRIPRDGFLTSNSVLSRLV
jgi:oxygen-independent coproporphyrinogen-3 oxidase